MFKKNFKNLLSNTSFLLFLIVIFGLILRLIFFAGMGISDDLAYSGFAYNIDKGIDQDSALTLAVRIGIIYITALSYSLFGVNDFSSVLFVLLTSIGNIILIFYFGKLLFNEKAGLMAAFLLSFFPLDVVYSTRLLTDIPSAFFMSLGVYFFLYSEIHKNQRFSGHRKSKGLSSETSKLKYGIGYLLSGLCIGIGYLIRESVVLIGLFFIIYVLYKKRIKKEYFLIALGFLIIFAIELLAFYLLTGDPLFRSTASQQYLLEASIIHNYFNRLYFPTGLFHYPYIILTTNIISYFYVFIFIAIGYCLIHRKKETYIMQLWFISLLLYLSFGSASLSHYIPFRAVDRYLTIITIPGIILLSFFLTEKKTFIKKVIMPAALIILLLTSILAIHGYEGRNSLENLKEIKPYLEKLDKTIYIDTRSIKVLDYISEYKNTINLKAYPIDLMNIKDAYIVINRDIIKREKEANKNTKFPEEVDNPPENWITIEEIGKDDENKIIIYYAP